MRKRLIPLLAAAVLLSCSKSEVVSTIQPEPIVFGEAFVDNVTKATTFYSTAQLPETFNVYGTVTGDDGVVNIYNGNAVTAVKTGETITGWNCGKTQYWLPDCTYSFVALAGNCTVVPDNNGMPAKIDYALESQSDLLYATQTRVQGDENNINAGEVSFTFSHLLSKVMFSFTNTFTPSHNIVLEVNSIQITDAPATGTYDFVASKWNTGAGKDAVVFGDVLNIISADGTNTNRGTSTAALLIPGEYSVNISFTVTHNKAGVASTINASADLNLQPGHSYNLTADLNSTNVTGVVPVTFKVVDNGWSSGSNNGVDL